VKGKLLSQFFLLLLPDQRIYIVENTYVCKLHPRTGHEDPERERERERASERESTCTYSSFFLLRRCMGWVVCAIPRPLCARDRPGTHCIGGWVDPRDGLAGCRKSHPPPGFNPAPSSSYRFAIPTTLSRPTDVACSLPILYRGQSPYWLFYYKALWQ